MEVGLYQAAAAMNATEKWQDMIADNLAGASTPGSRRHEISFSDVQAGMANATFGDGGTNYMMPSASSTTNFAQGEMKPTGNPMDFALEGPGFFAAQTANKQELYTRNGQFTLNTQGQLVTKQGFLVLGASGGPISVDRTNNRPLTISATGQVSQGDAIRGQLRVVDFSNPQQLTSTGGGYFAMNVPDVSPTPVPGTHVQQGYIEASNSSPTLEMASLITAMRMFETNQKVMTMTNDRMTKVVSDLGTPPQ
jgi:flagellar basal-body rod protein FlgG